jgi:hypothetical protein
MSKNLHPLLAGAITLLAATALLTGCSTTTNTPQQNESQVCAATKAYASALTSFKDTLTPTATVDHPGMGPGALTHDDSMPSEAAAKDCGCVCAEPVRFVPGRSDVATWRRPEFPDEAGLRA